MTSAPDSLLEAIRYFSEPKNALQYLVELRWPNGVSCPYCDHKKPSFLEKRQIWKCGSCRKQFSAKVGTIFEDSPLGLDKWLTCVWLIANCKNGVSSYEIARDLKVTQKSAWFMLHRVREAMQDLTATKLGGDVEVDETFIGGKARNMHKDRWAETKEEKYQGKAIAFGMVERGGKVRTSVVDTRKKKELQKQVRQSAQAGAAIFSDELLSYQGLDDDYKHAVINHAIVYVRGNVHTNTMENFWSLVKRQLHGTYISVEPYHLYRYLDEQSFRYNERHGRDAERFERVCRQIVGRRLTWKILTGKDDQASA